MGKVELLQDVNGTPGNLGDLAFSSRVFGRKLFQGFDGSIIFDRDVVQGKIWGKGAVEFIREWDPITIALVFPTFNVKLLSAAHALMLFMSCCNLFAVSDWRERMWYF